MIPGLLSSGGNAIGRALGQAVVAYYPGQQLNGALVVEASGVANNGGSLTSHGSMGAVQPGPGPWLPGALTYAAASSQYADIADNAGLSLTGPMSIIAWVNPATAPGTVMNILSKWTTTGNQRGYRLRLGTTGIPTFEVTPDGITASSIGNAVPLTLGVWAFVVGVYDGAQIKLSVNGSAFSTMNYSSGIADTTAPLALGCSNPDSTPALFWNGGNCADGVLNRALTIPEINFLYNDGYAVKYSPTRGFH